jgi:nucleoside-diphosphate-sugar epimerase
MTAHRLPPSSPRIAVIGATGFIGSATLRALAARGAHVTAISRRPSRRRLDAATRIVQADVTSLHMLRSALTGIDTVVHAASYTGSDPGRCEEVNHLGTRNVLTAASQSGVESVLTLSTIGVYGQGPFTGLVEGDRDVDPVTTLSVSRAAADREVRDHGGTVIRAGFIRGVGDRWFVPGLWDILTRLGGWVDDGAAKLSTIDVGALADMTADLALTHVPGDRGVMYHATGAQPESVRDLAAASLESGRALPSRNIEYAHALALARRVGLTARHVDLVGRDHTINGSKLSRRVSRPPVQH